MLTRVELYDNNINKIKVVVLDEDDICKDNEKADDDGVSLPSNFLALDPYPTNCHMGK